MEELPLHEFASVDESVDPPALLAFLDASDKLAGIRAARTDLWEALAPRPGQMLLDVACGAGTESVRYAHAVAPSGRVVALDASTAMLALPLERIVE